jgi:hypothetical protein
LVASRGVCMDLSESEVHSFVVKLWLDSVADEAERVVWQGQITHVPGGERRYFRDLDEIRAFIEPYLGDTAAERGRVRRWLRRWRLRAI